MASIQHLTGQKSLQFLEGLINLHPVTNLNPSLLAQRKWDNFQAPRIPKTILFHCLLYSAMYHPFAQGSKLYELYTTGCLQDANQRLEFDDKLIPIFISLRPALLASALNVEVKPQIFSPTPTTSSPKKQNQSRIHYNASKSPTGLHILDQFRTLVCCILGLMIAKPSNHCNS